MIPKVTLACLAIIAISSNLTGALASEEPDYSEKDFTYSSAAPVAEDRKFLGGKSSGGKKSWLGSLFARPAEPETLVHTVPASLEHYPIWKVHKYRGIELRPVHVLPVAAAPFPVQSETVRIPHAEYGPPVRVPHTEYGVPFTAVGEPFNGQFGIQSGPVTTFQLAPQHQHRLRAILGLLNPHKNLIGKLRALKRWKLGLKQGGLLKAGQPAEVYALPDVDDVPIKGLENLDVHVPELPAVSVPPYFSTIATVPYLKVKPAASSVYEQYPPQAPAQVYQPVQTYEEPHVPAPYYGAPPMFDSYGTPLPQDVYSSASSDHVPAFAAPESQSTFQVVAHEPAAVQSELPSNTLTTQTEETEEPSPVLNFALNGTELINQRINQEIAQNQTKVSE